VPGLLHSTFATPPVGGASRTDTKRRAGRSGAEQPKPDRHPLRRRSDQGGAPFLEPRDGCASPLVPVARRRAREPPLRGRSPPPSGVRAAAAHARFL